MITAFTPIAPTVSLAVNGSGQSVAFLPTGRDCVLRIWNAGPETVFVSTGSSLVTILPSTGMPIPASMTSAISVGATDTYLAAITPVGGAATIYVTPGQGLVVDAGSSGDVEIAEATGQAPADLVVALTGAQAEVLRQVVARLDSLILLLMDAYRMSGVPQDYRESGIDDNTFRQ